LRSQYVTSNRGGSRYAPFAFTEQGVAMLSSILKSEKAIEVNIKIIRIFIKIRQVFSENLNLKLEIEDIKKKLTNQSKNIELVFSYLDRMIEKQPQKKPRTKIGYK
ncbi:MAG: ORF6N domain-containing protein, partial [Flavobacteriaceae bacterium]|nr:ORF6N domain-containing protein [Flavobacteriaceae bacterium]